MSLFEAALSDLSWRGAKAVTPTPHRVFVDPCPTTAADQALWELLAAQQSPPMGIVVSCRFGRHSDRSFIRIHQQWSWAFLHGALPVRHT